MEWKVHARGGSLAAFNVINKVLVHKQPVGLGALAALLGVFKEAGAQVRAQGKLQGGE